MRFLRGNALDRWSDRDLVVTTNIGWDPKTLRNNMGAGLVSYIAERHPEVQVWYGTLCMQMHADGQYQPVFHEKLRIWFLPVKPLLDIRDPERSWAQSAKPDFIEEQLERFAEKIRDRRVVMTLPGCGNGNADRHQIAALLIKKLGRLPVGAVTVCDQAMPDEYAGLHLLP